MLSLDVEDWYHLDYFSRTETDRRYSLLDGVDRFCGYIEAQRLPATFFVVGEIQRSVASALRTAVAAGHEIASHGWDHRRPLTMTTEAFRSDLVRTKEALEASLGVTVQGYRAPCFSLDRERLEVVRETGHLYDSSRIQFSAHPLYGTIDMEGFREVIPDVHVRDGFTEFEVSTHRMMGRSLPVSGGGYLRIFPWFVMGRILRSYLGRKPLYVLYLHPFELSRQPDPPFPRSATFANRRRFSIGRRRVVRKLDRLVGLLRGAGFTFTTFRDLRRELVAGPSTPA